MEAVCFSIKAVETQRTMPCVTCRATNMTERESEMCVQGFGGETAWKTGPRWEDNIKMYQESGRGLDHTNVTGERDKSWSLVNVVIKPRVL